MWVVLEIGTALLVLAFLFTQIVMPSAVGRQLFPLFRRVGRAERELTRLNMGIKAARDLAVNPTMQAPAPTK